MQPFFQKNPYLILGISAICVLFFLYFFNPSDIQHFPRCPFLVLTGYQCPGCGTLRGIHALLNLRFVDALKLNPLMVASIPVIILLIFNRRFRLHKWTSRIILVIVIFWWVFRNL